MGIRREQGNQGDSNQPENSCNHDWVLISSHPNAFFPFYIYRCSKCNKMKTFFFKKL